MIRKLTNTEVADRLGVHHSYVSRMRSGERLASVSMLSRISEEYGVPVEELVAAARATVDTGDSSKWVELLDRAFTSDQPVLETALPN